MPRSDKKGLETSPPQYAVARLPEIVEGQQREAKCSEKPGGLYDSVT